MKLKQWEEMANLYQDNKTRVVCRQDKVYQEIHVFLRLDKGGRLRKQMLGNNLLR